MNTGGSNCNVLFCGSEYVPCHNGGTCTSSFDFEYYQESYYYVGAFESCQCSQENGIAKYHGESCEMPGRDACGGSPCQNGGTCMTQGENQACFIKNIKKFYKNNIMLKLLKAFKCSCIDGFRGDFCEFKTDQKHLLFVYRRTPLVFNATGILIEENVDEEIIDERVDVHSSCSTMLKGEVIIFGGWHYEALNIERQVN